MISLELSIVDFIIAASGSTVMIQLYSFGNISCLRNSLKPCLAGLLKKSISMHSLAVSGTFLDLFAHISSYCPVFQFNTSSFTNAIVRYRYFSPPPALQVLLRSRVRSTGSCIHVITSKYNKLRKSVSKTPLLLSAWAKPFLNERTEAFHFLTTVKHSILTGAFKCAPVSALTMFKTHCPI